MWAFIRILLLSQICTLLAYKRHVTLNDMGGTSVANSTSESPRTVLNGDQAKAWFETHGGAKVVSAAGKIVLNVPKYSARRMKSFKKKVFWHKPLIKLSTLKKRKETLKNWKGEAARGAANGGLIWQSGPDRKDQGVATDGQGIIIFNVDNNGAAFRDWALGNVRKNCCKTIGQTTKVMNKALEMGFTDFYDSDQTYKKKSFAKVPHARGSNNYYVKIAKPWRAFAVTGPVNFSGTAGATHSSDNGAVIVISHDNKDLLHIEKSAFQNTYMRLLEGGGGSTRAFEGNFPWGLPVYN
jgi:hypothetical protein